MVEVFAVPVFFICFRECLETVIICSVLLSFLKQALGPEQDPVVYKKLRAQIWWGIGAGLLVVLVIGGALIGTFYGYGQDKFSGGLEDIWEGVFSIVASIIITVMGAALLRVSKLQDKWRVKLASAIESKESGRTWGRKSFKRLSEKYAMFLLPFITVLREGLEAVVFIGGVSLGLPATAFPLAVICGIGAGLIIGYILYKTGNVASLQVFLIVSTCFLYLVAAGLMSKGVWYLENHAWNKVVGGDASEVGSGPGSYDIRQSVWHVNCCNPEIGGGGGWGIFNALFGWQNSATYGSVISYNLYWLVVITGFLVLMYSEKNGHLPFRKAKVVPDSTSSDSVSEVAGARDVADKKAARTETRTVTELPETPP